MKLWLLRPNDGLAPLNPWEPWFDKTFGFVVRAETEEDARGLAHRRAGAENDDLADPWMHSAYSTCVELTTEGAPGVVIEDNHAA